jgi:hypothetical protein
MRRKTGRASLLHHLLLTPFSSSPSLFFRIIMTFSAEFRCYIGRQTLAPWPTALAGLLPPWPTALGHDAVALGARPLTSWRTTPRLGHAKGPLLAAPTAREPRCYVHDAVGRSGICIFLQCGRPYFFCKIVIN